MKTEGYQKHKEKLCTEKSVTINSEDLTVWKPSKAEREREEKGREKTRDNDQEAKKGRKLWKTRPIETGKKKKKKTGDKQNNIETTLNAEYMKENYQPVPVMNASVCDAS